MPERVSVVSEYPAIECQVDRTQERTSCKVGQCQSARAAKHRRAVERIRALNSVERRLDCDGAMEAKKRERTEEQVSKEGSTHAKMQFIQAIKQSPKHASIS